MNNLYKYLPFDVKMKSNETGTIWTLKGYSSKHSSFVGEDDFYYGESKPILRPFRALSNDFKLTKAASQIIGISYNNNELNYPQEGDTINVLHWFVMILLTGLGDNRDYALPFKNINIVNQNTTDVTLKIKWDNYTTKHISIFVFGSKNVLKDCYSVANGNKWAIDTLYPEQAFDFLRAMCFAVDFQENEFITHEENNQLGS
jgi:hypothetical protein